MLLRRSMWQWKTNWWLVNNICHLTGCTLMLGAGVLNLVAHEMFNIKYIVHVMSSFMAMNCKDINLFIHHAKYRITAGFWRMKSKIYICILLLHFCIWDKLILSWWWWLFIHDHVFELLEFWHWAVEVGVCVMLCICLRFINSLEAVDMLVHLVEQYCWCCWHWVLNLVSMHPFVSYHVFWSLFS